MKVVFDRDRPSESTVELEISATSLRVTGRGEPAEDVPEVQRIMLSEEVLDVDRYPTITFVSREVGADETVPGSLVLYIVGDLTLHGTTRPQLVRVTVMPDADRLSAVGSFQIKQTDFGMTPPGAAGGLVKAKDELEITFSILVRPDR